MDMIKRQMYSCVVNRCKTLVGLNFLFIVFYSQILLKFVLQKFTKS